MDYQVILGGKQIIIEGTGGATGTGGRPNLIVIATVGAIVSLLNEIRGLQVAEYHCSQLSETQPTSSWVS